MRPDLINKIASDEIIDAAYEWLCQRRQEYSANSDIWNLRRDWEEEKVAIQQQLLNDNYRFSPQQEIRFPMERLEIWTARDALVLKAMTLVLREHLALVISPACSHIAGNGGAKKAVRQIVQELEPGSHVMRSDVKGYYASIDHLLLFDMLNQYINDLAVLHLLWQYMKRTAIPGPK